MIKRVVTPQNNDIHLSIPNSFIGKEVEVLLYTREELDEEKATKPNNAARFKGIFNKEDAQQYHQYLKQVRSEWDRDI